MQLPTTSIFRHTFGSETLDVILPGTSAGIESPLMQKLFAKSQELGHSTLTFNYPFQESDGEQSFSRGLTAEQLMLSNYLHFTNPSSANPMGYKQINLVAKSLGGIIAGACMVHLPAFIKDKVKAVVILGYIVGEERWRDFPGKIVVIQGEQDKFGTFDQIQQDLNGAKSKDIVIHVVPQADHSYRDSKKQQPSHENEAVELAFTGL